MTERHVILRENEKLLSIAKEIFGNIIENVYFQQTYFGIRNEIPEFVLRNLDYAETHIESSPSTDSYDLENCSVIVKFNNGRCVEFSCSEWGSIVLISKSAMDDIRSTVV